jgi:hypothetical protein
MFHSLLLALLASCTVNVNPARDVDLKPVATTLEPCPVFQFIDRQLGITSFEGERRLMLDEAGALTAMCRGHAIVFELSEAEKAFGCEGGFGGTIMNNGPLIIGFSDDVGPKYFLELTKTCGENAAELLISADWENVTVRCGGTQKEQRLEGDSQFVYYSID